jgi:ribonuclease Z
LRGINAYDKEHLHSARNLTGLQVTFLGTSGGAPTLNRNVSALALELTLHRSVNETWLFDCGEATQTRLMQSNLKLTNITKIFITHMHGDHIFGLPGVLCMLSNARAKIFTSPNNSDSGSSNTSGGEKDRDKGNRSDHWSSKPIHIYGPPGLANFITMALGLSETGLSVPIVIHEFSDQSADALASNERGEKPFTVTHKKLRNRISVEKTPADKESLTIRGKIEQLAMSEQNKDKEGRPKRYSWRKQHISKNGVRRKQAPLDRWECMRWNIDLYDASEAIEVVACPLKHRVDCWGYVIKEKDQPGKMDMEKVKSLGLPVGPILKELKNGKTIQSPSTGEVIKPEDVLGPAKPGRKVVILGDTCDNRWIAQNAKDSDLVIHEATFTNDMRSRAFASGHSTAGMAGNFAKYVDAGTLILNHFSARFEDTSQYEEMRKNTNARLRDLIAASRDQEFKPINTLKKQAIDNFGKNTVYAAEDLMVFCIEKKDPEKSYMPSAVFPRHLGSIL